MSDKLEIAIISSGTHRAPDLAHAILREWGDFLDKDTSDALSAILVGGESDESAEAIDEALDELQDYAPWLCRVGFHEGDGACLGCFPDFDAIDMDERDGNLIRFSDISELGAIPVAECSADYALYVNDHGNCTLYSLTAGGPVEQWAVV